MRGQKAIKKPGQTRKEKSVTVSNPEVPRYRNTYEGVTDMRFDELPEEDPADRSIFGIIGNREND